MPSRVNRWPPRHGPISSIEWSSSTNWDPVGSNRRFWIGRDGFGFMGSERGYNVHWETMYHPWQRWSRGDYHWVEAIKQILRGVKVFLRG